MATVGAWLIGSRPNVPETTVEVTANSVTENVTIPAGDYYLDDSTASLSLAEAWATALATHSEITAASCVLSQDRLMRTSATVNGTGTFTATFPANSIVLDMLGYNSNLSPAAASFTADRISSYLWVPGRTESPQLSRLGTEGRYHYDTQILSAGTSHRTAVSNNKRRHALWKFYSVDNARVWSEDELGGEWITFFDTVLVKAWLFKLYRNTTNDESSTSDVSLSSANRQGPYVMVHDGGEIRSPYERTIPNVEQINTVTLEAHKTIEYGS